MKYKHTQIGYLVIFVIALLLLVLFSIDPGRVSLPGLSISVFILFLFFSLTVEIDEQFISIKFGIGLINKKFKLSGIDSCRTVKNHWYNGWGIRLIPGGWLYNVSGYSAIELTMKNGKKHRIGTDEPEKLQIIIAELIK